jgi:hypothetical protein
MLYDAKIYLCVHSTSTATFLLLSSSFLNCLGDVLKYVLVGSVFACGQFFEKELN